MATISISNEYGHATLTYSVSSTNDTTTVTVSRLQYVHTLGSSTQLRAISVVCDGTTLYSGNTMVNNTSQTVTLNKTKSFSRGTSAASKTLKLSMLGTSKSATVSVPVLPSYKVTFNANGGSGAPAQQTKYYGRALTLSTTKPTRANHVFKSWNTKADGTGTTYASGGSYKGNAAVTLYAQWYAPYTVSYNANGGSGAPSSQVKVHNQTLRLSSARPTRADFSFLRWNTSSSGSGTNYASGADYTANANATLYAQWQRTYSDPSVTVRSVQRVGATTHEPDDSGTSVEVTLLWSLFDTPSGTNHPVAVVVACNGVTETLTALTGLTGTTTVYVDANCLADQQYEVTVTLTDEGGESRAATASGVVTTPYYPIDIRQGGKGVAIGGPSNEDALDIFMPTKILPRSTSAQEVPFTINDGTDDVLTVDWDGTLETDGEVKGVASQATMPIESAAASCGTHVAVRNGNQVTLYVSDLKLAAELANGSATGALLTVPAGYRPPYISYAHLAVAGSNVGGSYARVGTDGLVTIRNQSGASIATTTNIAFTLTYVA
jgi:hypothetical protein